MLSRTTRRRKVLVAATAVMAVLAGAPAAQATFPGANGRIAFNMADGKVHTINPDGTGESVRLSDSRYVQGGQLAFSWGGSRLAWTGQLNATTAGFTSPSQNVSHEIPESAPGARHVSYSPDGRWAVFSALRPRAEADIFAARLDGSQTVPLAPDPTSPRADIQPEWSPDGQRIVFVRDEVGGHKLRLIDFTAGTNTVIETTTNAVSPSWSPDGTRIAYLDSSGTYGQVMVKTLATPGPGTPVPGAVGGKPTWSPDGTRLAFLEQGEGRQIVTVAPDGSDRRVVRQAHWDFDVMDDLAWAQDCRVGPAVPATDAEAELKRLSRALEDVTSYPYVDLQVPADVEDVAGRDKRPGKTLPEELASALRDLEVAVDRELRSNPRLPGAAARALREVQAAAAALRAKAGGDRGKTPCPPRPGEPQVRRPSEELPLIIVKGYQGHGAGVTDRIASKNAGAPCAMFNQLIRRFRALGYEGPIRPTLYMNGDTVDDGSFQNASQHGPLTDPGGPAGCINLSTHGRYGDGNPDNHKEHWGTGWDCSTKGLFGNCPNWAADIDESPDTIGVAYNQDSPLHKGDHCRRWGWACNRVNDWTHFAWATGNSLRHTDNTPNQHVAYHLAWMIWHTYTRHGIPVNILSHSQGGTQVRYMLQEIHLQRTGSSLAEGNFPSRLLVNEVVSVGSTLHGSSHTSSVGCDDAAAAAGIFGLGALGAVFGTPGQDYQCLQQMPDSYFQTQGYLTRATATGMTTPQAADVSADPSARTQWAAIGLGEDVVAPRNSALPPWADFHVGYCGSQYAKASPLTDNRILINHVLGRRNVQLGTALDGDHHWSEAGESEMGTQFRNTEPGDHVDGGRQAKEYDGHFYFLLDFKDRKFRLNGFTYTTGLRQHGMGSREAGPPSQQQYACKAGSKEGPQPLDMAYAALTRRDM